jgi:hypothetical protein
LRHISGVPWLVLLLVIAACGPEAARKEQLGVPPVHLAPADGVIPAEPQRAGDPERGWAMLTGEAYVGCGVPRTLWDQLGGMASPAYRIDRPRGAELPYFMNGAKLASGVEVVTANCLGCHAAFLRGELVIGLGEASADFTLTASTELALAGMLLRDAERAEHGKLVSRMRTVEQHARARTVGANPADHIAAVLFAHRDPETLAWSEEPRLPLSDDPAIPVDVPAWWLLKKKTAMFHTGAGRGDQARIMMTASVLCVDDVATARAIDSYFPDIRAFVLSLEPPRYPGTIDAELAGRGRRVFERACSKCHGTYGPEGRYQSRVVLLAKIGTDPMLAQHGQFAAPFVAWFNRSFYGERARLEPGAGYVAPPLDGVWATAPYLHNGSVPNLAALLDSSRRRPRTRIVRGADVYDLTEVGWPNEDAPAGTPEKLVYDASLPGYSSAGHTFGDRLSATERTAVLEYLKTL